MQADVVTTQLLVLLLYKLACLAFGFGAIYMGYRLFLAGIWGKAGDFTANLKDAKIVLRGAAPGTFFALFGATVIGITVWKGFETGIRSRSISGNHAQITLPQIAEKPTSEVVFPE